MSTYVIKLSFSPFRMPDLFAADLSNVYVPTGTHTYVHKNDDNDTGEMNQIRQICSAQGLAQQSMLMV